MMEKYILETSVSPEVIIREIQGSLTLKGWDEPQVLVKAQRGQVNLQENEDQIVVDSQESCRVYVPTGANVQIKTVHGAAEIKLLEDRLTMDEIHGPVTLRNLGEVEIGKLHGHLWARNIAGDLQAADVQGHAEIRSVEGNLVLENVEGNLEIRDADQDIQARASGNVQLRLRFIGGANYLVEAGGNLNCRIPVEADLELELASGAEKIRLELPGQSRTVRAESFETTLGAGGPHFRLSAGGLISLSEQAGEAPGFGFDTEWAESLESSDDLGQQISDQIEKQVAAQMDVVARQIEEQMTRLGVSLSAVGLSEEEQERIIEQARRTSERANERAQERIRRSQERLQRKLEAARRRSELKAQAAARRSSGRTARAEWGGAQPVEAVSEEERLMILKMLEQKKISLEEAENLLQALEGN